MKCHHASERMMAIITQSTNKVHKELKSSKGRPLNNGDWRYEIKPYSVYKGLRKQTRRYNLSNLTSNAPIICIMQLRVLVN